MATMTDDAARVDVDGIYVQVCDEAARGVRFARMARIKLDELMGERAPQELKWRVEELGDLLEVLERSNKRTRRDAVALAPYVRASGRTPNGG